MKKYILLSLAVASASVGFSQKSKVVSAYNYNKAFTRSQKCNELKNGLEAINAAKDHDQTKHWAKTWYYRGNLYWNILATNKVECKTLAPDALEQCTQSYLKALVLNFEDPELKKLDLEKEDGSDVMKFFQALQSKPKVDDEMYLMKIMGEKFPGIAGEYANKGFNEFNKNDYKAAQESFGQSMMISQLTGKMDTTILYNTALASEYAEDYEGAVQLYETLTMLKYNSDDKGPSLYLSLSKISKIQKDTVKANKYIAKGRVAYPNNQALIFEEIDYFLKTNKNDEALANLNKAIENDNDNAFLYYVRGNVYDKLKDKDNAFKNYEKAIELDPKQHDAYYNLGAHYYNVGVSKLKEAEDLPLSQAKKYDALKAEAKVEFGKGLPYIEKAHEIKPSDTETGTMLIKLYTHTGQYEKSKEIKAKFK